jgi:hypothetical protein
MEISQIVLSAVLGFMLFCGHIFLLKISPKVRKIDNKLSDWENDKIEQFLGLAVAVRPLIRIIANNYGYIAVGNAEISRVYAHAPPCAPPEQPVLTAFQVYELLQILVPPILDELQETENQLKKDEIRNYTIQKLTSKVAKNPHSYPLNFAENLNNFSIFEKNIKKCIHFQILPTLAIATKRENKKAETITKDAVDAMLRTDVALDAELPADNGKATTLHDLVGSDKYEPLQILLAQEMRRKEQAALASLSESEKNRLLNEFDERRQSETGELFDIEPTEQVEKPVKPAYRRQPKPLAAAQPLLFHQGVAL